MATKKALIIEDDKNISELISIHLQDMEYQVDTAFDGKEGLLKALNETYEFIILDIMLPSMDGFEVCRQIRMEKNMTPILMLTSKSEEIDKVLGLEMGADDYLTKPFSVRELVARIKAILRRASVTPQEPKEEKSNDIIHENISINIEKRIVEVHSNRVELSPKEFDLLILLASNPGKTYSREQLLNQVWGYEFSGYEHTVNSHINRLRTKIEQNINSPEFILTTWGVGYRFKDN